MIARAVIVVVVAALLAVQVVKTALVAHKPTRTTWGARLWPAHPAVLTDRTMAEIGAQAARGESPPPATLRRVEQIARRAPLAAEPFLIKGALAQVERNESHAERLFAAARNRDPRSVAARYFLADRYLRSGRIAQALSEIAVLSRLFAEGRAGFAPALAQFAKTPGAVPQLRRFFRSSPEMAPLTLSSLADEPANADLILILWGDGKYSETAAWQPKLVSKLIEQGQYAKAYAIWRQVAGVGDASGSIFNPRFEQTVIPPPFNWALASAGGVVEPAPGGRLQIIYYGRADAVLAEQLLLLAPGRYELGMEIAGPFREGAALAWKLTCVPKADAIFGLPIDHKGRIGGSFAVPANCPAQRLQLTASPGEFPQSQEFTVGKLGLTKLPGA